MKFGENYPTGPCQWEGVSCHCGWIYNRKEVKYKECESECEVCDYCGSSKCPQCDSHLHCGGCI